MSTEIISMKLITDLSTLRAKSLPFNLVKVYPRSKIYPGKFNTSVLPRRLLITYLQSINSITAF